jgi:membrane-associated protease RseP (regulator of RpoE activity)
VVPPSSLDGLFPFARPVVSTWRWLLHGFLLAATLLSTTVVGVGLAHSFAENSPVDLDRTLRLYLDFPKHPAILLDGLPFSITLLLILLAHEMGHYLTCVRYGIDASLPYFLPAPPLIGTFGAFIRIRSPIYTKRALFDVGISGPLAGFAVLLPALAIGMANSKIVHGFGNHGDFVFGTPLIQRVFEWVVFPGTPGADIYLHPVARAAWVGVLATALNLLPIGQLDGGHVLYSFIGDRNRLLSKIFVVCLAVMAPIFGWTWLFWALLLFFFGLRHPVIFDASKLDSTRIRLGWLAVVIFLLSFTLTPIRILAR